jgi:hypothetical protein
MSEKYDLVFENLSTIQSLIAQEQSRIVKEGTMNRSTAYHKACNNVGRNCILPPIDGPELASWVGTMSAQRLHSNTFKKNENNNGPKNGKFVMPKPTLSTFDDSDPYLLPKRRGEGISENLRRVMRPMKSGQFLEYDFDDKEDARRVQRMASHIALDEKWPRLEGDKPSCKTIVIEKVDCFTLRIYRLA